MQTLNTAFKQPSRIEELEYLRTQASKAEAVEDIGFRNVLSQCQILFEMPDQELADVLSVSRPTVSRWIRGKNLPHPVMRKSILGWIGSQVAKRIRVRGTGNRQLFGDLK